MHLSVCSSRYKLNNEDPTPDESGDAEDLDTFPIKDVSKILKDNYERQKKVEKPLDLCKRKSRRKRDYWLGMAIVNPLLVLPYFLLNEHAIMGVFSLSGITIFSAGFTWVMWSVIDDY